MCQDQGESQTWHCHSNDAHSVDSIDKSPIKVIHQNQSAREAALGYVQGADWGDCLSVCFCVGIGIGVGVDESLVIIVACRNLIVSLSSSNHSLVKLWLLTCQNLIPGWSRSNRSVVKLWLLAVLTVGLNWRRHAPSSFFWHARACSSIRIMMLWTCLSMLERAHARACSSTNRSMLEHARACSSATCWFVERPWSESWEQWDLAVHSLLYLFSVDGSLLTIQMFLPCRINIYTCMHIHIYIYVCIYVCIHMYVYIHAYMYKWISVLSI